jgi:hypothetical protein
VRRLASDIDWEVSSYVAPVGRDVGQWLERQRAIPTIGTGQSLNTAVAGFLVLYRLAGFI